MSDKIEALRQTERRETETMNAIVEIFEEVEDDFPDKSTEFLMQMTCDVYFQRYRKRIDNGDIAAALVEASMLED